ncbi:MAG: dockerin type I domain-containing protein, partial [Pirellulaceae bacterium]
MKNRIGQFFQRLKHAQRTRENRRKALRLESLEGRRLLAADTAVYPVPFPYQNDLINEDVSGDYNVSALDALLVVNAINEGVELAEVEPGKKADGHMLDVSGDNFVSPLDALIVMNFLNGEGETTPTAIYTYEFVDSSGSPLSGDQVAVGDIFQLQTYVEDTRGFSAAGINAAYLDIAFDNDTSFDVAVGEIQTLKFFVNQLDTSDTSSSFTLSLDGQTTNAIPLFDNGAPQSDAAIAASIQTELEALSNVGAGNVSAIVDQAAKSADQENNVPRFNFEIRFGNELAGQDLPLLTLDDSNIAVVSGGTFDFAIAEVLAGNESTPAAEAAAFVFGDVYDFARRSEVTANEFNEVGAASQQIPLPQPAVRKLVFTIPMIATAPGVINFTPNEADDSPASDMITGTTVIPTSMVDYGASFSITVVTDPTAPIAVNDTLTIEEDSGVLTLNGNVTSNDTVTAGRTLSIASVSALAGTVGT